MSDIQRTTFDNGLTVVSEYMPQVRSVALGAWVRSASIHEPRHLMGVSHMLEHMVFKGTEHRTAREIALSLERLGGSLDAYTTREHTAFQWLALREATVSAFSCAAMAASTATCAKLAGSSPAMRRWNSAARSGKAAA